MSATDMYVVQPVKITASKIVSTTATESVAAWVSGTSYAKDDQVAWPNAAGDVRVWISLVNSNTETPGTGTQWLDDRPCNKCAMFDSSNNTSTVADGPLVVTLNPGGIVNSVALFNVAGQAIQLEVLRNGVAVYDETFVLSQRNTSRWSEYYFGEFDSRTQAIFGDLPFAAGAQIRMTITGGSVSVGNVVMGRRQALGSPEIGAEPFFTDYSRKQWDADFGSYEFVKRDYSRGFRVQLLVDNGQLNRIFSVLTSIRATPTLFVTTENELFTETLVTYGVLQDARIVISYPNYSLVNLTVEGLT